MSPLADWLISFSVLLFGIVCHEAAHAWMAFRRGDPTAYLAGRLTLNPLPHLDPVGSVLLPLVGMLTGAPLIGWARPVPVDPRRLSSKDQALVSLAGPSTNAVLALVFAAVFALSWRALSGSPWGPTTATLFSRGVVINLFLAAFNLLPIPPLDGSWIAEFLWPRVLSAPFQRARPFGYTLLLVLVATGALRWILSPVHSLAVAVLRLAAGL